MSQMVTLPNGIRVSMSKESARRFLGNYDAAVGTLRSNGTAADAQQAAAIDSRRVAESVKWSIYKTVTAR